MSHNVKQEIKFFIIFIPVMLFIVFVGWLYLSSPVFNYNLPESELDDIAAKEQINMVLSKKTYSSDVEEMTLEIINNSSSSLEYGEPYYFEVYDDGTWYQFPYHDDTAWISIGYFLKPNQSRTQTLYTARLKHDFLPGKYRVIKHFHHSRDRNEEIILSAEFEVE